MSRPRITSNPNVQLIELHERLLADDPTAPPDIFEVVTPVLERGIRAQFPSLAPSVDPDIYVLAVYDALTDYFKNPHKYDPDKSSVMSYLRLAAKRDMLNLLKKEKRHATGRVSIEDVEFHRSDGNDFSERIAQEIDGKRLIDEATLGMTSEEEAVFRLMLDGIRDTSEFAKAMKIQNLPRDQWPKRVKRVKDRIKRRLQRKGPWNHDR